MDDFGKKYSEVKQHGYNKYLLVNVVAKRARSLNDGARPEAPLQVNHNPLDLCRVALQEMEGDRLRVEPKERAGQLVDIAGIVK